MSKGQPVKGAASRWAAKVRIDNRRPRSAKLEGGNGRGGEGAEIGKFEEPTAKVHPKVVNSKEIRLMASNEPTSKGLKSKAWTQPKLKGAKVKGIIAELRNDSNYVLITSKQVKLSIASTILVP